MSWWRITWRNWLKGFESRDWKEMRGTDWIEDMIWLIVEWIDGMTGRYNAGRNWKIEGDCGLKWREELKIGVDLIDGSLSWWIDGEYEGRDWKGL